jgi:hypothetical protein
VISVILKRQAGQVLARSLQPGERVVAGLPVTCGMSLWGAAALLPLSLTVFMAGLAGLLGWWHTGPVIAVAMAVPGLVSWFSRRWMHAVLTDRRLIFFRFRFRGRSGAPAFAVPLADIPVTNYRCGRYGTSIECELPGRNRVLLHARRGRREDLSEVDSVLTRSGVYARVDPPWPAAEN